LAPKSKSHEKNCTPFFLFVYAVPILWKIFFGTVANYLNREGRRVFMQISQSISRCNRGISSLRPLREPFFLNRKGRQDTQGNWAIQSMILCDTLRIFFAPFA
jgi:GR25 family glycosyltransferase involved in LPS biosynthesis